MTSEKIEPYLEHLSELRNRAFWVAIVFVVTLALGFIYAGDIFRWFTKDTVDHITLNALSPGDPLKVYMQIAFLTACFLTIPFFLLQVWLFVRPGLFVHEQKATVMYLPFVFLLWVGGFCFAYFVIYPLVLRFTSQISDQLGIHEFFGIYQYFSFMMNIVVPVSLLFELPVIVLFLTRMRLITPMLLQKVRRIAYLLLVIISAMIAPPDLASNLLIAIPLLILYEISIGLSTWLYRKMEREMQIAETSEEGLDT